MVLTGPASECQRAPSRRPPERASAYAGLTGCPYLWHLRPVLRGRAGRGRAATQPPALTNPEVICPQLEKKSQGLSVLPPPTHPQPTGASGLCGLDQALGPEPAENK